MTKLTITQLKDKDKETIVEYIKEEPEMNLFLLGDLEAYGVETEEVSFYAVVNENQQWDSIIMRYFEDYLIYSKEDTYNAQIVKQFLVENDAKAISGKETIVEKIADAFPTYHLQPTYMCRCRKVPEQGYQLKDDTVVRAMTPSEIPQAIELYLQIKEFENTYKSSNVQEQIKKTESSMEKGGLLYGAFHNGKLVACAETSGANSLGAMVVGVATVPDQRGKGYASAVVEKICRDSFKKGLQFLCLFYDNPEAGKIYHKMGFEEIGEFALFR